jgi:hypothetical protein
MANKSVFGAFVSTCAFARRDGVPAAHVSQPTSIGHCSELRRPEVEREGRGGAAAGSRGRPFGKARKSLTSRRGTRCVRPNDGIKLGPRGHKKGGYNALKHSNAAQKHGSKMLG